MGEYFPREWFAGCDESFNHFLIVELGLIPVAGRVEVVEQFSGKMWPLIQDQTQQHLIGAGPWLIQIDIVKDRTRPIAVLYEACHAWIRSKMDGRSLGLRLMPALRCISPSGELTLLRFYCPDTVKLLRTKETSDWFHHLFDCMDSWHYRMKSGEFEMVFENAADAMSVELYDWLLEVDDELWGDLLRGREVDALLDRFGAEAPGILYGISHAKKRERVTACLVRADKIGLSSIENRAIFSYLAFSLGDNEPDLLELEKLFSKTKEPEISVAKLLSNLSSRENL